MIANKIKKWTQFLNESNTEYVDLFEYYEQQPAELKEIVDKYLEIFEHEKSYDMITKFHDEVYAIGYTFDSGLDAEPYGLRPIGVKLTQLKGWENIDN